MPEKKYIGKRRDFNEQNIVKLEKLIEKQDNLAGKKISAMLWNLKTSQEAVNRNYEELESATKSFEDNSKIWNPKNKKILDTFFKEISRLLQNYLSSTFSLVSHTTRIRTDLKCEELNREYTNAANILNKNSVVSFCRDLRNYVQHVGLLPLSARSSRNMAKEKPKFRQNMFLDKNILLADLNWKEGSKKYINSHEQIVLKDVVSEYQNLIKDFYDWFFRIVHRIFTKELKEFEETVNDIRNWNAE